jgi:MYXO-CTERM domain-containing protein
MRAAASSVVLILMAGFADAAPEASPALRDWSPCLTQAGAAFEPGAGPWRLVAAALEPDSPAPLCGGAFFCPDAPLSGGAGAVVFRFLDEAGARVRPPAVRGKILGADGVALTLDAGEDSPEGPVQRYAMPSAYAVCAGERGGLSAAVDDADNDGLPSDRVTGLGLPDGRPVNVVLTWQRNPPRPRRLPGLCNIQITTSCPLPAGTVGQSYSAPLSATGGGGIGQFSGVAWTVNPPSSLPPGLAVTSLLNSSSISGTPTTAGSYTFSLVAVDVADPTCTATMPCSITVGGGTPTSGGGAIPPQYTTPGNDPRGSYASGGPDDTSSSSSGGGGGGGCAVAASSPATDPGPAFPLLAALLLLLAAHRFALRRS